MRAIKAADLIDDSILDNNVERDFDCFIAAFEAARNKDANTDLADFLPDRNNPLYLPVLRELVRVDLECKWTCGQGRQIEHYRQNFPELFDDRQSLQAICFEEFRLRRQAGEDISPAEYQRQYGVETQAWAVPPEKADSRPSSHSSLAIMPKTGETLLGFELVGELGRGAFATVFLARQRSLADRFVAIKISRTRIEESGILARLQHTNIVPIYSVHRHGPFQVICMPFFGATTLADLIRLLRGWGGLPASGDALAETLGLRTSTTPWKHNCACQVETPATGKPDELLPAVNSTPAIPALDGATGWEALSGLTYVEAVLWIGSRLADGLYHAHQRGILHRDLKPANVLLADDGRPMLLDFNLSEDVRPDAAAAPEFVGGTLPYMAPECLLAYQRGKRAGDARSDIYSLGIILYQLLAGRHPFPARTGPDALSEMLADRRDVAPRLQRWNKSVSPATEAVVRKCLAADPKDRYHSADDLRDDLDRQLKHEPLRHVREPSLRERAAKWVRRHPRLTSATSIALAASVLVALLASGLFYRNARLADFEAADNLAQFRDAFRAAQTQVLDASIAGLSQVEATADACRQALRRFAVIDNPAWQTLPRFRRLSPDQQLKTREDVGELLFLSAAMEAMLADTVGPPPTHDEHLARAADLNRRAELCYPDGEVPAAVWQQRALLAERQGEAVEARADREKAEARPPQSTRDCGMAACTLTTRRRYRAALPLWRKASSLDPQNVWAWFGLGHCYGQLSQPSQAAACYTACIALKPDFPGWYFNRGLVYLKQKDYALANADFDKALQLRPAQAEAHFNRALARLGENRCREAIADLEEIIYQGHDDARTRFLLARARDLAGDQDGAQRERLEGLKRQPTDELAWVARAVARSQGDPAGAVEDLDRALQCNPFCLAAMESKANLLSERLGRTADAIGALDRAVATYPENGGLLAARGVLLARVHRDEAARKDARSALDLDRSPAIAYQVAGIYALLSQQSPADFDRAIALLASALRDGYGGDLIATDKDLDPIRQRPQFQQLLQALRTLQPAATDMLSTAHDGRSLIPQPRSP
jgi:eukaryotic-like serine/threonine-protein kinase